MKLRYQNILLLMIAVAMPTIAAAQSLTSKINCDKTAISWILPGHFKDAQTRAKNENRILIIKGLGFGLDEVGATCATKGDW